MTTPATLPDREYIAQFDAGRVLGIVVNIDGTPAAADGNAVSVTLVNEDTSTSVWTRSADNPELGAYAVTLSSEDTDTVGSFRLDFSYDISSQPQIYSLWVYVGAADPAYNALSDGFRDIIESVYERFADGFDSVGGGPYVQMKFQSHFGRGRMARLLTIAINRLNTVAQPHQSYSTSQGNAFPFQQWGGLLEEALYIETIKHLMRIYTEQPDVLLAGGVSRLDRRDYQQRWATILEMEQSDLERMMDTFKIANMGLSNVRVLVAGGLFGSLAPNPRLGGFEGRPRFYPVPYQS